MITKKEIKTEFKKLIKFILSDDFVFAAPSGIKAYHKAKTLYWVLGGEGKFPIQVFPEVKVLNTEKLYQVF